MTNKIIGHLLKIKQMKIEQTQKYILYFMDIKTCKSDNSWG